MKKQINYGSGRQQGVVLPIVMVIIVLSALIVLYMANTSRKDQQISADQYRTEQSLNAAMAGLDWAIDYYNDIGLDDDEDDSVDFGPGTKRTWYIGSDVSAFTTLADATGDLVVKTDAFFCDVDDANFWSSPELCTKAPDIGTDERVGVVSIGYSDDDTARRVITVVLAGAPLLPPTGPGQPLTTKNNIGFTGNITIINRYFNVNAMSGGPIILDGSAITVVAGDAIPLGADRFADNPDHRERMISTDTDDADSLIGSTEKRGANADALGHVPILADLSTCTDPKAVPVRSDACTGGDIPDQFFTYFLEANKEDIKSAAKGIGQYYENCDDIKDGLSGIIWIELGEGETCKTDVNFGSLNEPAAVFFNGNMDLGGTVDVYGLLYVTGDLSIVGSPTIFGSVIVEGEFKTDKAGTLNLVYDPVAVAPGPSFTGLRNIDPGTWRDWATN